MSPAQNEALRAASKADTPVKLNATSARILHARWGYLEPAGDGLWQITDRGRCALDADGQRARWREVEDRLSREARDWAQRVEHWLAAHARFGDHRQAYPLLHHARHVVACDHDGETPALSPMWGTWTDEAKDWVEREARAAAACLRDYDTAEAKARERGVGVEVVYGSAPKVPRARKDAVGASQAKTGVIALATYRERRPS